MCLLTPIDSSTGLQYLSNHLRDQPMQPMSKLRGLVRHEFRDRENALTASRSTTTSAVRGARVRPMHPLYVCNSRLVFWIVLWQTAPPSFRTQHKQVANS